MNPETEAALREVRDGLETALQTYWRRTADLDPWTNGLMDSELKDLDPDKPDDMAKRDEIVKRHEWAHEIMVGQRMAMDGYLRAATDLVDRLLAEEEAEAVDWREEIRSKIKGEVGTLVGPPIVGTDDTINAGPAVGLPTEAEE